MVDVFCKNAIGVASKIDAQLKVDNNFMSEVSEESGGNVKIEKQLGRMERELNKVSALVYTQERAALGYQLRLDANKIDFLDLWNAVWDGKWLIFAVTAVFAIASVVYALSLPNIYKAEALLAPSEESQGGGLSALVGNLGGLASLAGVNLGSGGSDKTTVSIEIIKSRQFIVAFVEKYNLLVPLMAAKSWNLSTGELILDAEIYDKNNNKWVRDISPPRGAKPSNWEVYKAFSEIFNVSQDKKTGLITVSVELYSPVMAQEWIDRLVFEINAFMRTRDVLEATKSIGFLNQQLNSTPVAEMRQVFSQLIEEQTKTIMLAQVRDEYVFTTLDPAVVAEEKSKPKRSLICVLAAILGGVLGVMIVSIKHFYKSISIYSKQKV